MEKTQSAERSAATEAPKSVSPQPETVAPGASCSVGSRPGAARKIAAVVVLAACLGLAVFSYLKEGNFLPSVVITCVGLYLSGRFLGIIGGG